MLDILVGMLKRERQRLQGNPSSSDNLSDLRDRKTLSERNGSGQNSHATEKAREERQQPFATREEANFHSKTKKASQRMTDDMSQGRREAFEVFRADYAHNGNIEENKQTLKQRYSEAKSLGEQVNNSRKKINTLKTQIEQHRIRRSMQVEDDGDSDEEARLRHDIEEEKSRYKEAFTRLRSMKTEIEHLQHILEKYKVQMQKDFEVWWNEQSSLPAHKTQIGKSSEAWKTPTPPLSPIKSHDSRPRSSTDPRPDSARSLRYSRLQTESKLVPRASSGGSERWLDADTREDKRFFSTTERKDVKVAYEDAKRFSSTSNVNDKSLFNLTGDSRADEDIMAFIKARQLLIDQRGSKHN